MIKSQWLDESAHKQSKWSSFTCERGGKDRGIG